MPLDRDWHKQQCRNYTADYPAYETYADTLESILKAACKLHAPLAIVQARPKSIASFAEKMARKAADYQPRGLAPTDLCGARVITETEAEVERISKVIRQIFTIDKVNSQDVRQRLKTGEFGYLSVHYVVQLRGTETLGVPIPPEIGDRKAEIQVRTLLQHAWASIDHDRVYKSKFTVPDRLNRELARVAALLEEADQQFGAVVAAIDEYRPNYGVSLTESKLDEEIEIVETVLHNQPGPVAAIQAAQVYRVRADWQKIAGALAPYLDAGPAILVEHGHALCRLHAEDTGGVLFLQGYGQLQDAAAVVSGSERPRILGYRAWASARIPDNGFEARHNYRAAYEADPKNPFHLAAHVEYEIHCGEPMGFRAMIRPVLEQAIGTYRSHAQAGIQLPSSDFTTARFHFLLDDTYGSLNAYAVGIRRCLSGSKPAAETAIAGEIAFLRKIYFGKAIPEEHDWVLRFLLLARHRLSSSTRPALVAKRTAFVRPVVILAGGTSADSEDAVNRFRPTVLGALEDFRGTVISGGTSAGVAGLAGQVSSATVIGYLPKHPPGDPLPDARYSDFTYSDGRGFGAADALQYWTDLVLAGIPAEEVRLIGIEGGPISAFEYRLALALGAQVALLEPAKGAAEVLRDDPDWQSDPNLLRIPDDTLTLRAFLAPPKTALDATEIETVAQRIHQNFLDENRYKNPDEAMKPWNELKEDLKISNRMQAERAAGFLEQIGYLVERSPAPIAVPKLTDGEIERLAEMEHGRWVVERLRSGWRFDPTRDPPKKLSPHLVEWASLTGIVKGYDRTAVAAWPALLADAGFALRR